MTGRIKWIIAIVCIVVLIVTAIIPSFLSFDADYYATIEDLSPLKRICITVKTLVLSSYTVIAIAFSMSNALAVYFFGKELDKEKYILFSVILFTLLCIWHATDLMIPTERNIHIWLYTITFSGFSIFSIIKLGKKDIPSKEKALVSYAKSRMNKWTGKIACFEVYSVEKREIDSITEYSINYLDGCWKSKTSLNAVLTTQLLLEHQDSENFKSFFSIFHKNITGEETLPEKLLLDILSPLSRTHITSIKDELSKIERKDTSTSLVDCCKCRLINVYLGCIDSIEKNHSQDYIGFECASINVSGNWGQSYDEEKRAKLNLELNDRFFTEYRTGLLGAILLPTYSFAFNYEQKKHSYKADRKYIAFTIEDLNSKDTSLLVLLTIDGKLEKAQKTVNSIKKECFRIGKD